MFRWKLPQALVLLCVPSLATTHTVHPVPGMGDFTTPSAALASPLVVAGDTIEVMPGTYSGPILVDKAVRLIAVDGPSATVLDGGGLGPVVDITAGAQVRGFTITGGGGPVSIGGVRIASAETVRLRGNVVFENHPTGDAGIPVGGVRIVLGSTAILRGNDIHSNTSLSVGGLLADPMCTVQLVSNKIRGNGGSGTITGGLLFGASGRMVNNQITGNHGSGIGGVYLAGGIGPDPFGATVEIVNCTIYGNRGASPMGSAGGIFLDDGGAYTIRNTLIHSNLGMPGGDVLISSDFFAPPTIGSLDLDYSHVMTMGSGVMPGMHMVPPFLDPLLIAPALATIADPTLAGDFHAAPGSPLLDAGLDAAYPGDLLPHDLDGLPRFNGTIDIGAFERFSRLRGDPDRAPGAPRVALE
jgi:hypothetical protein